MTEFEQKIAGAIKEVLEDEAKCYIEELKSCGEDTDEYVERPCAFNETLNSAALNSVHEDIINKLFEIKEYSRMEECGCIGSDNVCINEKGENYCEYSSIQISELDYLDITIQCKDKTTGKYLGYFDIRVKFHPTEDCTDLIKYRFVTEEIDKTVGRETLPWQILK